MYRVLMVCTANVCRSPLGEAILKKQISENQLDVNLEVSSCGIWASDDQQASTLTEEVARENGIDLSRHRSRSITSQLLQNSDLILCMSPEHCTDLKNYFPLLENRIFTLRSFNRGKKPEKEAIDDPIGLSYNIYRRVYHEIESEVERIFPEIKTRALQKDNPGKK